jgi:cytochrome c biogenesis protein CcmG, thiol:disulfide interchange protein DsbE
MTNDHQRDEHPPHQATPPAAEPQAPSPDTPSSEPEDDDHGRVGYGQYARYSPAILAILIVVVVVFIGWRQAEPDTPQTSIGSLVGKPAPDFTLTLLSGEPLRLDTLAGQAVALNFWGSWCVPCEEEMPELEAVNQQFAASGIPGIVVGVGTKRDNNDNALQLVEELQISYPIGRDTAGNNPVKGPIEAAYGVTAFPATIFIRPDGIVSAVRLGQIESDEIVAHFEQALSESAPLASR